MMVTVGEIRKLTEEFLDGTDKFIVEVKVHPGNKIFLFIDGDNGVNIADCQKLSRYIESKLNRDNEDFELNVSSSGLDRPFGMFRQYRNNIGKEVEIILVDGEKISGIIENTDEATGEIFLVLPVQKKNNPAENKTVNVDSIKSARVKIKFK
jgi:ribosome maturation factor RimP